MPLRRLIVPLSTVALMIGSLAAGPDQAFGHAAFVGASPEPGARVESSPREVALSFTESLNRRLTSVKLTAVASGEQVPATIRAAGASRLSLRPRRALGAGAYRVDWRTVSTEDGHALEGTFSFGVRAAAAGGAHVVEQSPLARGGALRIVARGVLYVAALLFVAALVLPRLVGRDRSWLVPRALGEAALPAALRRRERSIVEALGWLATIAAVVATAAEAGGAAGSLAPRALRDFLLTGEAGIARLAVIALLAFAALVWPRLPRTGATLGALALGAIAASGHASSASPRLPSILNDWVHLVSAAVWLGGIGLLSLVWGKPLRRASTSVRADVARHVLVPFGRVAMPAFVLVSATGLVSLVTQLGHVSALWQTDYGRLLALKIAVVGLIAAVSAIHALRLRPRLLAHSGAGLERETRRHWRLVRIEPALGLGVVAVVAVLVAFPLPPRQLGEAGEARATAPTCDPCPLPKAAADELAVATRAGSHLVAGWVRRTGTAVTATVRVSDIRNRPVAGPLRVPGATVSSCGPGCGRVRLGAGSTSIRVIVSERGRIYTAELPTRWERDGAARAAALLRASERTMRGLHSLRQAETVTSGPGSYARTDYRLRAPDRMAYRTSGGNENIVVGRRQWFRTIEERRWERSAYGAGVAFRTRQWFRWTVYGRTVRLLGTTTRRGRRVATLALFDEATPVWLRLTIDLGTRRVIDEHMTSSGHFMTTRYYGFNRPVAITAPGGADGD